MINTLGKMMSNARTQKQAPPDMLSKRLPIVQARFRTELSKDQLYTVLVDLLDWGPFEVVNVIKETEADDATCREYHVTCSIDRTEAEADTRSHFEWGLMLLGIFDNHFMKEKGGSLPVYRIQPDHMLTYGVTPQNA
jgi:hypothetical protein